MHSDGHCLRTVLCSALATGHLLTNTTSPRFAFIVVPTISMVSKSKNHTNTHTYGVCMSINGLDMHLENNIISNQQLRTHQRSAHIFYFLLLLCTETIIK